MGNLILPNGHLISKTKMETKKRGRPAIYPGGTVKVSISLPADLLTAVRDLAAEKQTKLSPTIANMVRIYLEKTKRI